MRSNILMDYFGTVGVVVAVGGILNLFVNDLPRGYYYFNTKIYQ